MRILRQAQDERILYGNHQNTVVLAKAGIQSSLKWDLLIMVLRQAQDEWIGAAYASAW